MRRALIAVLCALAAGPAGAQPGGRPTPPPLGPPPKIALPPIHEAHLANGMRLLVVERHEIPLVDAVLVVGPGPEADSPGKDGLATLVGTMLTRGTPTRSATDIAAQTAALGASIDAAVSYDHSVVVLHVPTATLDSAWSIFADVALHPAFPDSEFALVKRERLTALLQVADHPPAIAGRAFESILYGPDTPYGHPSTGTTRTVESITAADARDFYHREFAPQGATLIVVGDVSVGDITRRAETLFGAWHNASPPPTAFPPPSAKIARTTIYVIDKQDAPQSSIRIGSIAADRATPDYFPIEVMNTILGGAFTSRLNQNLRETHAYTYGAFSDFAFRRAPGPFIAEAEVVAAKTDSSMIQFMRELRSIRDTVPTPELRKAKKYLELQLPGALETSRDIAGQLVEVAVYGLPLDFYNTYQSRIAAVTQADVQRVARKYIQPTNLAVIIVGDRAKIEPALRSARIAPVEDRTLDGQPITQ